MKLGERRGRELALPGLKRKDERERRAAGAPISLWGRGPAAPFHLGGVVAPAAAPLAQAPRIPAAVARLPHPFLQALSRALPALRAAVFSPWSMLVGALAGLLAVGLLLTRQDPDAISSSGMSADRESLALFERARSRRRTPSLPGQGLGLQGGRDHMLAPLPGDLALWERFGKAASEPAKPAAAKPRGEGLPDGIRKLIAEAETVRQGVQPGLRGRTGKTLQHLQFDRAPGIKGGTMKAKVDGTKLRDAVASLPRSLKVGSPTDVSTLSGRFKGGLKPRQPLSGRGGAKRAISSRAMGQLKYAQVLSASSALYGNGDELARRNGQAAFDQAMSGGSLSEAYAVDRPGPNPALAGGGGGAGGGSVAPLGAGAPDRTSPELPDYVAPPFQPNVPPVQGRNVTPYQGQVDDAKKKTGESLAEKLEGMMLIASGLVQIGMGVKLLNMANAIAPCPTPLGGDPCTAQRIQLQGQAMQVIASGIQTLMQGIQKVISSLMKKNQAQGQGDAIARQYGQVDQGRAVNQAAQQAHNGRQPNPDKIDQRPNGVAKDVDEEAQTSFDEQAAPKDPGRGDDNGGPIEAARGEEKP